MSDTLTTALERSAQPSLSQLKRLEVISAARFHVGAALGQLAGFGYHEADTALDAAESSLIAALHALLDEPLGDSS